MSDESKNCTNKPEMDIISISDSSIELQRLFTIKTQREAKTRKVAKVRPWAQACHGSTRFTEDSIFFLSDHSNTSLKELFWLAELRILRSFLFISA